MSAPIDIRGILERAGADAFAPEGSQALALAQVGEVVAGLIDCVGDAQSLLSEIDSAVRAEHAKNGHPKSQSVAGIINARLTAALARIGGAS